MLCPVLTQRIIPILLRMPHAVFSTDTARPFIVLRMTYAMSGTDPAYGATRAQDDHARAGQCLFGAFNGKTSTVQYSLYRHARVRALIWPCGSLMSGTEIAYRAMGLRLLRDVRY
eukprot:1392851-Rhodomonas_salina.1